MRSLVSEEHAWAQGGTPRIGSVILIGVGFQDRSDALMQVIQFLLQLFVGRVIGLEGDKTGQVFPIIQTERTSDRFAWLGHNAQMSGELVICKRVFQNQFTFALIELQRDRFAWPNSPARLRRPGLPVRRARELIAIRRSIQRGLQFGLRTLRNSLPWPDTKHLAQPVIDGVNRKCLWIEVAPDPFQHVVVLLMVRVANGFQKAVETSDSATIFGRTVTLPIDTERVCLALLGRQDFLNQEGMFPAVAEIVGVLRFAALAQHIAETYLSFVGAGGDGVRLRGLTRFICGNNRPKQFYPLLGECTLLEETRERAERSIYPEQHLPLSPRG